MKEERIMIELRMITSKSENVLFRKEMTWEEAKLAAQCAYSALRVLGKKEFLIAACHDGKLLLKEVHGEHGGWGDSIVQGNSKLFTGRFYDDLVAQQYAL